MKLPNHIKTISRNNSEYPLLLNEIPNPPKEIYLLGNLPDQNSPHIAIVGTRKATAEGRLIAKKIAQKLTELGATIVSGLAMGIDTAAHEGALTGNGKTVAVLACGLDEIYPRQNENLAKKILETNGAIISEYPIGTPAYPDQFLARNRIVSGLSVATIVIEAPIDSGALVTARLAAEQGREVFIIPGPINHPNYRGSHKLIRDGARLTTSIEDILEDLGSEILNFNLPTDGQILNKFQTLKSKIQNVEDKSQLLVLKVIQEAGKPLNIDKIIEITKLEPQIVSQTIAILTIQEIIKETEKGYAI